MNAVVEELRRGLERIKRGWCQGAPARTFEGESCASDSGDACSWCSWGAIGGIYGSGKAERFLKRVIGSEMSLLYWNDDPGRTKEEVLAAFDRAIALAEAEGGK